ncbi:26S proteasome regulatory subunit T3, partial [Phenoliferia sp. Uapishka_3]
MEEIGINVELREDPTFTSVVEEKATLLSALPQQDLYLKLKKLEQHTEFLALQEEYIKDEMKNLKRELIRAQEEVKRIQSVPLVIGQFLEPIDQHTGIVGSTTGSNYVVRILSTIDRELLKPSSSVALHRHSNSLVDVLPPEADSSITMLGADEKPDVSYADIGGMDIQKQEIREAVELPLTQFDLYRQIGIEPPRGVLLYGPPGTGKTMLVKAVAHHTTAAFIRVVGSEFVQKYLGEGPRMVRDVFRLARENAPAIIFIDEIDAIATKRFDAQTGADREVQRILLELLNQMDGFDQGSNVKVIMATNRADTLDPALLRPGRLDRKIEFPLPSRREKRLIFQTVTSKMSMGAEVDLEDYVQRPDKLSCAEISSICQAAGLQAVRKNRYVILPADFEEAWKQTVKRTDETLDFSLDRDGRAILFSLNFDTVISPPPRHIPRRRIHYRIRSHINLAPPSQPPTAELLSLKPDSLFGLPPHRKTQPLATRKLPLQTTHTFSSGPWGEAGSKSMNFKGGGGGYGDLPVQTLNTYQVDTDLNINPLTLVGASEGEQQQSSRAASLGLGGGGGRAERGGELVEVADKDLLRCVLAVVLARSSVTATYLTVHGWSLPLTMFDRMCADTGQVRCKKRGENCEYGDDVAVVMRRIPLPGSNGSAHSAASHLRAFPRITSLSKSGLTSLSLADFEDSLHSPFTPPEHSPRPGFSPYPQPTQRKPRFQEFSLAPSSSEMPLVPSSPANQPMADIASSWDAFLRSSDIGPSSVDWKLAQPAMAYSLTLSLLDASMHSCCFHLPAFRLFEGRLDYYKTNLANLDLPSQVAVAILTSLGARASPHSALLGVEGADAEKGAVASREMVLTAGRRREKAWRKITDRALTLCGVEMMNSPTRENIEVVLAITNALLFSEVVPTRARFFLRQALGLFKDVHSIGLPEDELLAIKKSIGPALYESDARTAAYANMPFLIRASDLSEFFNGTGVLVPNLAQQDLGVALDNILSSQASVITRAKLDEALALTGYYVSAIQRNYAAIATGNFTHRDITRLLYEVSDLWSTIDRVHGAVQKLHRTLSALDYQPPGCEADHALDYDLLIGVRMDARMVDIVNLAHMRLLGRRDRLRWTTHSELLEALIATSEKRVRKCLKLLAFYSRVYSESLDRHLVYHLVIQAECIPWVPMVVQRVGEEGGPTSVEYELSELELDWFTEALELACFYTPMASTRLRELQEGRDARRFSSAGGHPDLGVFIAPLCYPSLNLHFGHPSASHQSPATNQSSRTSSVSSGHSPSSHHSSPRYSVQSPGPGLDNTFDFTYGGAYSPAPISPNPLDLTDFSALLAAGGGQSPPVMQAGNLPYFDEQVWREEAPPRW